MGLEGESCHQDHQISDSGSESESGGSRIGYSGPLNGSNHNKRGGKRSPRFKEEEAYVEITLDVREDSVTVNNIIRGGGDAEMRFLGKKKLEKQRSSLGTQLSFKIKQVSKELRRLASSTKFEKADRSQSAAALALRGLQFMTDANVGGGGWAAIERRFDELAVGGTLQRSSFGQCIGNSH